MTDETPTAPGTAPTLTDGVVTLRPHTMDDVDAITEQASDPESLRWTTVPRPYGRADAAAFVESNLETWRSPGTRRTWAVEWVDDTGHRRFGGTIDLRPTGAPSSGELGFGLHPDARGRGLMARSVRLVTAYAFETGGWGRPLTRVHWRAIRGNWGSRRAAWAAGFTVHGTLPGSHPDPDGGPDALDTWFASIGAGDAPEPQAPWFDAPVIAESGLRLRPWRDEDAEAVEAPDAPAHWVPPRAVLRPETYPAWLQAQQERMADGLAVSWCVADATTDRALGGVALFSRGGPLTGDSAELGYQLFPSARGRGVAKAAAALAVRHGFTPREQGGLGLRRLTAETAADNAASNAVLAANGFVSWGREHRVDELPDGAWGDGLHWELFRDA